MIDRSRGLRAGDIVKHTDTGEHWILAYARTDGTISWFGWPEGVAQADDVELVKAATDEEHLSALHDWADKNWHDHRCVEARRQLADLTHDEPKD